VTGTMRAVVLDAPGPPEALHIRELPIPEPRPGWILIQVKAFGLNRSELHTRVGLADGVTFPRVLGIEAAGIVAAAPGGEFPVGAQVAAMMGGMGRTFDGGYAEYTCVPAAQVIPFRSDLDWTTLGAVPEAIGVDHAIVDDGEIAAQVRAIAPGGVDRALELVGTPTLPDTLRATRVHGVVCFAGILSGRWTVRDFYPIEYLPSGVHLTAYGGDAGDLPAQVLQSFLDDVAAGRLTVPIDRSYALDEIATAHADMEAGNAVGKLVVLP
jgi:NADPH:quinone reductase